MKHKMYKLLAATLIVIALLGQTYTGVLAVPIITNLDDTTFTKGQSPIIIDSDVTFTGGGNYADGHLLFDVTNSTVNDQLVLTSSGTPTATGSISVVGSDVYLGNGTDRDRIGSVDGTQNGQNGQPLLIHFSSPLENYSFEDGMTGWSSYTENFNASSTDYSQNLSGTSIPYYYNGGVDTGMGTIILGGESGSPYYNVGRVTTPAPTDGTYSLRLSSSGTITGPSGGGNQNDGNGSLHGPYVASTNTFHAYAGDTISLDWQAQDGADSYEVFGYLVQGSTYTTLFSQRGDTTGWETENVVISTEADYRFLFVCGTYDQTGGLAVGASLYIDNIRLISAISADDAVVSSIAQQITFENTSGNPSTTTRTLEVSAQAADATTALETANIFIVAQVYADLAVTEDVLRSSNAITYTIVAQNDGPSAAGGAVVSSTFSSEVISITWTCVGSGGATCGSGGTLHLLLNDTLTAFPDGGVVTYTVQGTLGLLDTGNNVVTVTPPSGVTDPDPSNNRAEYINYRCVLPLVFRNAAP